MTERESGLHQSANSQTIIGTFGSFATPLWVGVLGTYVLLLAATGYFAFLRDEYNPAHADVTFLEKIAANKETQTFVLDTLRADSATYQKKRELAAESFNVVLGALLGFLSASAVSVFPGRPVGPAPIGKASLSRPLQPTSGAGESS